MTTFARALVGMMFAGLAVAGSRADAAPGDGAEQPRLEILDAAGSSCGEQSELCVLPGASSTQAAVSHGAIAGRGHVESGPRFTRILSPSGTVANAYLAEEPPWTLEVAGPLRHPALAGNTLFLLYDADNPRAFAEHEVTALWQASIRAGNNVAARLVLSPSDGFRPGHTYRIRVAQLVAGKQVLLAEGTARLQ